MGDKVEDSTKRLVNKIRTSNIGKKTKVLADKCDREKVAIRLRKRVNHFESKAIKIDRRRQTSYSRRRLAKLGMVVPYDHVRHDEKRPIDSAETGQKRLSLISVALQSTASVAFISATLFYIGSIYYRTFFGSFGDGSIFPPLGTADYLVRSFDIITNDLFLFYLICLCFIWIISFTFGNWISRITGSVIFGIAVATIMTSLLFNAVLWVTSFLVESPYNIMHEISRLSDGESRTRAYMYMALIMANCLLLLSSRNIKYHHRQNHELNRNRTMITNILLATAFSCTFLLLAREYSAHIADKDAQMWKNASIDSAFVTRFTFDPGSSLPRFQSYRVIILRGGNYYAVPLDENGSVIDMMIVIPESEVRSATVMKWSDVAKQPESKSIATPVASPSP